MQEKVGIFLVAEVNEKAPKDKPDAPRYPVLEGRLRCLAVKFALEAGLIDKVAVVGGAPDSTGHPFEDGYYNYLQLLLQPEFQDKVEVLPRPNPTCETIGDLSEALSRLRERNSTDNLVVISNFWHLYPRVPLMLHLENAQAELITVEDIITQRFIQDGRDSRTVLDKVLPKQYRLNRHLREALLTSVLLADFIPFLNRLGTKITQAEARKRRVPNLGAN